MVKTGKHEVIYTDFFIDIKEPRMRFGGAQKSKTRATLT